MKLQFSLTALLLLNVITTGISSECSYEETEYYLDRLERVIEAVCYEETSGLNLDLKDQDAGKIKVLRVTSNSTIGHLEPTSTLSSLTELRVLLLTSTKIEEISTGVFDDLNELIEIDLRKNLLENLPAGVFSKLVKLKELDLSDNRLTRISASTFDKLESLKGLYLQHNLITHLDDGSFSNLVALRILKLQENKITLLQEGLFSKLTKLFSLDISDNPLEEIQDVGFNGPELHVLAIKTNLRKFDMNISDSSVEHLQLQNGQLEEFDFANLNPTNDYIGLSKNRLKTVKNLQLATAATIDLDNNNLTEITNISPHTVGLFLQHNQITSVKKIQDPSQYRIMFLDLSFNQLESATCFGLPRLQKLNFQNNRIVTISQGDFLGCFTLYELNLAFNRIETIEPNAFKNLNVLKDLFLSNNHLKNLNPEYFVGLNNLDDLYFENNQISSLDVVALTESIAKLKRVKIWGNPIKCEDLDAITLNFEQHGIRVFQSDDPENSVKCVQD